MMSKTVEHKLKDETDQLQSVVISITGTLFIMFVLAMVAHPLLLFAGAIFILFEVFLFDYKYYSSTIWTIMYNATNDLGLTCPHCGYDYHCNCDSCKKRRNNPEEVGWLRLDCGEYDCGEQCPKCGKIYSSSFLEDLDYEIYSRSDKYPIFD